MLSPKNVVRGTEPGRTKSQQPLGQANATFITQCE